MKKEIFIGCGVFLCLSKVSGMTTKGMAETDGRCANSLVSEMTLNSDKTQVCRSKSDVTEIERRKLCEKLSDPTENVNNMLKVCILQLSLHYGRDVFQKLKDSDDLISKLGVLMPKVIDYIDSQERQKKYDENTYVTDVLAEIERRELCEELSDPTENVNNMLKVCILQLSLHYGRDVFQKLKDSDDLISKLRVLMPKVIDYIDSQERQKKKCKKKKQERGQIREKNICSAFPSEVRSNELFSSVIRYMGDMVENMAHGIRMVSHIHRAFSITGTFFQNYLDLHEKIEIKGPYGEKYEFMGNENFSQEAMISLDDISKVGDVYNIDLSTICLKLSNDDGGNEYILFNSDFIYQGELRGRDITGRGRMFRITGEVQEGEFEDGEYLCKK